MGKITIDLTDYEALLTPSLEAMGKNIEDVRFSKIKMNLHHSSITVSKIEGGATILPVDHPLRAFNEDNIELFDDDRSSNMGSFAQSNALHSDTNSVNDNNEAVAYAMISHGPDGEGSYKVGTNEQIDNIDNADENPMELKNHDPVLTPDEVYYSRKIVSDDVSKKFDDLVMLDSQITLYNSLRNGSCESAQAQ